MLQNRASVLRAEQAAEELARLAPDVVGLSAMTYEAGCMHELARLVRERLPRATTVCGGPHPSVAADDVLADPAVDFVVRGEGELTFVELLDGLADRGLLERTAVVVLADHGMAHTDPDPALSVRHLLAAAGVEATVVDGQFVYLG